MAQPRYITQTSSGSSPWMVMNWHANPINIGLASVVSGMSSQYQIDVTLQDPSSTYVSPVALFSFLSSQAAGGGIALSSLGGIGVITQPIAALRLTVNSTAGTVTLAVLQSGMN